MQIIVLEYDVRYSNAVKENLEAELKILTENFRIKEDEANFLRNKLSSTESGNNNEQLFYQEINKIRDLLKEKTSEFIKLDQYHNQTQNEIRDKFNLFRDQNIRLNDENEKLKEILKDILTFHINSQHQELINILDYLKKNAYLINGNQNTIDQIISKVESSKDNKDLNSNNLEEEFDYNNVAQLKNSSKITSNQREEFAEKVLSEFDKIFTNELKRIERFFRKNNQSTIDSIKRKSSLKRKNSAEKNYYEWKIKTSNQAWAETLRGRDSSKNLNQNNLNTNNVQNLNMHPELDFDHMLEMSRSKIRNSIKSSDNVTMNINTNNISTNSYNVPYSNSTKNLNLQLSNNLVKTRDNPSGYNLSNHYDNFVYKQNEKNMFTSIGGSSVKQRNSYQSQSPKQCESIDKSASGIKKESKTRQ